MNCLKQKETELQEKLRLMKLKEKQAEARESQLKDDIENELAPIVNYH